MAASHGTFYSYNYLRCRCNACRKATREYQAAWKAKARARGRDASDAPHGTRYSYDVLACRCPDCTRANTELDRIKRARRKARALAAKE